MPDSPKESDQSDRVDGVDGVDEMDGVDGSNKSDRNGATPTLVVEDVAVELGGRMILEEVSFSAGPGVLVGILGPNGAGKSTLLNAIAGLLPLKNGRILIDGRPVEGARGQVAYVPQQARVK